MINHFKCKETKLIWCGEYSKRFPLHIQNIIRRKLRMLNNALNLNDLRVPLSNHLESLKGDRANQYSIRINKKWRMCFEWINNNAYEVEILDYH